MSLAGNPKFDVVLALGNSLCLVPSLDRRQRALAAFYEILRPGGVLVIDERNYEFMRRNRERILADPLTQWLRPVQDVIYPGKALVGFPTAVDDAKIEWSFAANTPEAANNEELRERALAFHPLDLYAFQHGELYRELGNQGFVDTVVYGDLCRLGDTSVDGMPDYEATKESAFLTYVTKKPTRAMEPARGEGA
jgi:SAM-dependent methyltransferase